MGKIPILKDGFYTDETGASMAYFSSMKTSTLLLGLVLLVALFTNPVLDHGRFINDHYSAKYEKLIFTTKTTDAKFADAKKKVATETKVENYLLFSISERTFGAFGQVWFHGWELRF